MERLVHLVPTMHPALHVPTPQLAQHVQVRFTPVVILAWLVLLVALRVLLQILATPANL